MKQYAITDSRNPANTWAMVDRQNTEDTQINSKFLQFTGNFKSDIVDNPFIYLPSIQHLLVQSQQQKH